METIKEEAIHHTALKLAEEIKNLSIYKSFYSDVQASTLTTYLCIWYNLVMRGDYIIKVISIMNKSSPFYQKLVSSPNVKKEDFKQTLQQAMKEKGLDTKLRNTVFHWVQTQSKQNVSYNKKLQNSIYT